MHDRTCIAESRAVSCSWSWVLWSSGITRFYRCCPAYLFTEVTQRYGVSRKQVYVWLRRYREEGVPGLVDLVKPRSVVVRRLDGLRLRRRLRC